MCKCECVVQVLRRMSIVSFYLKKEGFYINFAYLFVARIVTNLMLTGDLPLLINYGVALTLNVGIILSALYLRKNPATAINPLKSQDDVGSSQSSSKLK